MRPYVIHHYIYVDTFLYRHSRGQVERIVRVGRALERGDEPEEGILEAREDAHHLMVRHLMVHHLMVRYI